MSRLSRHTRIQPCEDMDRKNWSSQHESFQNFGPNMAGTIDDASTCTLYPIDLLWAGDGDHEGLGPWENSWQTEQLIVPNLDNTLSLHNDFGYDPAATKDLVDNSKVDYPDLLPLLPSQSDGLFQPARIPKLGPYARNSYSPKSYFDTFLEPETSLFSPTTASDQTTSDDHWSFCHTSSTNNEELSSQHPSPKPHLAQQIFQSSTDIDRFGLPRATSSFSQFSVYPTNGNRSSHVPKIPFEGIQAIPPEYSWPQDSGSGSASWNLSGYTQNISSPPLMAVQPPKGGVLCNVQTRISSRSGRRRSIAPAQDGLRDRSNVHGRCATQSQRKHNDEILIQGKKNGLTYKDIREKMLGEKPAESTLRGRYRSLTKAKKDRVRKPLWKKGDVELLNEFVAQEFSRIESTFPNPHSVSLERKLAKVTWKKVSDFINEQGGSYHFGNSTCKRKWLELHSSS